MPQNRASWKTTTTRPPHRLIVAEALEVRRLLSAVGGLLATPADMAIMDVGNQPNSTTPNGYTPTQIKAAYGISNINFNTPSGLVSGNGAGQTIAIIDPTDNPAFVDTGSANFASSDLAHFDATLGLPDPPSFTKVNYDGTTDFSSGYQQTGFGWANEIALDVEWSHAIAPMANILLVETPLNSGNAGGLIAGAVNYARSVPGVSVISMSFQLAEQQGESVYDQYFTTPTGHTGVTFLAATGDTGDPGGYPAFSPNVVAVGATSLTLSNSGAGNAYVSEIGHNTSGGGISAYEAKPTYQNSVTLSSSFRTIPDVSFDGDQYTGVPVYNSVDGGSNPWYMEGGTSFSTPAWAGLVAIADQGRAALGLGTLDGATQTLPRLYELNSSNYHDITSGPATDGTTPVSPTPGYDLVTGLGSPVANLLVPDLAGGNTVSGTIFNDKNGNGQLDSQEPGLNGFSTFVDLYGNSKVTGTDPQTTSTAGGVYQFTDLPGGTFHFTQNTPAGWNLTTASAGYTITLGFDSTVTGKNIGYESNGTAAQLVFVQQPTSVQTSTDIAPAITVEVEDAGGNVLTNDNSAVTLSVTGGSTPLSGGLTENAVNGIATFRDISVATAGTYTLLATDARLASASSNPFTVSVAPPVVATTLVFGQQVATASVGSPLIPAVNIFLESPNGAVVSTDQSAVTLSLAAGSTTNAPSGALTVNAVNGIATFSNIVFSSPGTAALTATDGTLTPATSNTFSAILVPSQLRFSQQPTASAIGAAISPAVTVDVEDLYGDIVTAANSPVTLTVTGGTAALDGTATVNAVNGVATFNNISLPTSGTFKLNATDGALNGALSDSFVVAVPGTVAPTLKRSTLAASYIAGSRVHATVSVGESSLETAGTVGMVGTSVYAVSSDGTTTLLGHLARLTTLKNGRSYPVSVPVNQLPSLAGTYSIQVQVTDPTGNTSSTSAGTLVVAPRVISLSETFTRLTLLKSVVSGSSTRAVATLRITNTGNVASTGNTTVAIYASPDGSLTDATFIAQISRRLSIPANRSVLLTVPLKTIPSGLDGNFAIIAQVTDPNLATTSVSSNTVVNIAPPTITLAATLSAARPASVAPGRTTTITLNVSNSGNTASTGTATISIGLTLDGSTELPGSTTLQRVVTIPLGRTVPLRLKLTVPSTLAAGVYFPFVSFDQAGSSVTAIGTTGITVT